MLNYITPVLLTYNEAPNIARTLSSLAWAKDIVVVDSGSTDETLAILARVPNVRIFHRSFDSHGNQWHFAVQETAIATPWVLRLDADYQVTGALIDELAHLNPDAPVNAYRIAFDYAIFSHRLTSSLYPANTILLRVGHFSVEDKGHTETWSVDGPVKRLKERVVHDDWKPTEQWLNSQGRYMRRELESAESERKGLSAYLRLKPPLMPMLAFFYCLFGKGLIFNGRAGMFYALQRLVAEATLSLMLLEKNLRAASGARSEQHRDGYK